MSLIKTIRKRINPSHAVIVVVPTLFMILHNMIRFRYGSVKDGIDLVSLGLLAVALIPFFAALVQSAKLGGIELNFVQKRVEAHEHEISSLKFLVTNYLTEKELEHLERLSDGRSIVAKMNFYPEVFRGELHRLRGFGLIRHRDGKGLMQLFDEPGPNDRDVHQFFYTTEKGRQYLALRRAFEQPSA